MPTRLDPRLILVRTTTAIAGLYLAYGWFEAIRWNPDKWHLIIHLSSLSIFVCMAWKAWRGSTWAGVMATLCSLALVIPFTSDELFLVAMGTWNSPGRLYFHILSTTIASITWTLLPILTPRLTRRSNPAALRPRTQS